MKPAEFKVRLNPAARSSQSDHQKWGYCIACGKLITVDEDSWDVLRREYDQHNFDSRVDTCSRKCANIYILGAI